MFSRVLVPTDFSSHAEKTVACITEIPGIEHLVLLHVLERGPEGAPFPGQNTVEERIRGALDRLNALKDELTESGHRVKVLVHERVHDSIPETILSVASGEKADLIALGARGRTLRSLVLGSVSASVLRDARVAILLVHDRSIAGGVAMEKYCRSSFARVLIPVDFSKPSLDTVRDLPRLARPGGEVTLLHVLPADLHGWDIPIARRNAEKRLGELEAALGKEGFRARTFTRAGNPAVEILRASEDDDCTLLVLSRFGKKDYVQAVGIGSTAGEVARRAQVPVLVHYPLLHYEVVTRELAPAEFPVAEDIWLHYHQQRTDPTDRLFATFADEVPAGVARCRRHPDGLEVDGVFTLDEFRNRGYARRMVEALVSACGKETLYMHSTLELVPFYRTFGFEPISEEELPRTIRERFSFALGDMAGAHVQPMRREGTHR
ncbi:MAG: GNAT family N-acetyltransferase [Methanomicrobiales archaeon]